MSGFPKIMNAAVLMELNQPLVISEITLPGSLEIGQVLVKIKYSGICGTQIGEISGAKGADKFLPHLLGHEASGEVISIGPGVTTVYPGDKVVLHWRKGIGINSATPNYFMDDVKINAGWITTFNEYAIVSENRCTKIPSDLDLKVAALFGCAITTGFGVVENNAKLKIGESIVVYGAGGIGLNIVQAASLVSAYPIIAIDRFDERLSLAKSLGATHTINSGNENDLERVAQVIKSEFGRGLDVFVDNTGLPDVIEKGYGLVKGDGRVVLVGVPRAGSSINIYSLPLHFGKTIAGSHGGDGDPTLDIPRYLNLARAGLANFNPLITDIYKLSDVNKAISDIKSGACFGRALIEMN